VGRWEESERKMKRGGGVRFKDGLFCQQTAETDPGTFLIQVLDEKLLFVPGYDRNMWRRRFVTKLANN
jgi:hypothetical protein